MATHLGSLVQLCCGDEGTLQTNTTDTCWECLQWMDHTEFTRAQGSVCFLELPAQSPGCSARALSQVSPAFHALPSFKLSGSWVLCKGIDPDGLCVLCPSQVWVAQVTGCLGSTLSQVGHASYSPAQSLLLGFPGVSREHSPRCAMCPLWGTDLRLSDMAEHTHTHTHLFSLCPLSGGLLSYMGLSKGFSAFIDMIILLLFLSLLMWYITLIHIYI